MFTSLYNYLSNYFTSNEENDTRFYYLSLIKEESGYSIHGLWPQTSATTYPSFCRNVTFDASKLKDILPEMEKYWYSNQGGQTNCTNCSAEETSTAGSTFCSKCDAGKFMNLAQVCEFCLPGKVSTYGKKECTSCEAGYYTNVDLSGCEPCAAGKYSEQSRQTTEGACVPCQVGTSIHLHTCGLKCSELPLDYDCLVCCEDGCSP